MNREMLEALLALGGQSAGTPSPWIDEVNKVQAERCETDECDAAVASRRLGFTRNTIMHDNTGRASEQALFSHFAAYTAVDSIGELGRCTIRLADGGKLTRKPGGTALPCHTCGEDVRRDEIRIQPTAQA